MATTLNSVSTTADRVLPADLRTLLVTQKAELIGEVAQAMANQFNNIMMAITSYAELKLKKASDKERSSIEQLLAQANQATALIQKLLDLSRRHISSPRPVEIDGVINGIGDLLKEIVGEKTNFSLILGAGVASASVDRIDLEQTLLSLAIIARNAATSSGALTISTALTELDREFIGPQGGAQPGKYVVLSVESTATQPGPLSEDGKRDQSVSINLSFAAAREIVKDGRGLVRLSTEPNSNCRFSLYLPLATSEPVHEQERTMPRNPVVARTVLVVEDDEAVRVPASEFLMMDGFKVLQARTGVEALNVVQQSRSPLDVLVTDIFMPKMNGHDLAAKLLEQNPELKILYMSGDPGRTNPSATNGKAHATLRKPFRLNTLRDRIHDLLGE